MSIPYFFTLFLNPLAILGFAVGMALGLYFLIKLLDLLIARQEAKKKDG